MSSEKKSGLSQNLLPLLGKKQTKNATMQQVPSYDNPKLALATLFVKGLKSFKVKGTKVNNNIHD